MPYKLGYFECGEGFALYGKVRVRVGPVGAVHLLLARTEASRLKDVRTFSRIYKLTNNNTIHKILLRFQPDDRRIEVGRGEKIK